MRDDGEGETPRRWPGVVTRSICYHFRQGVRRRIENPINPPRGPVAQARTERAAAERVGGGVGMARYRRVADEGQGGAQAPLGGVGSVGVRSVEEAEGGKKGIIRVI